MLVKTTIGAIIHNDVKFIYKCAKRTVDIMIKLGKIKQEDADFEWANIVVEEMTKRRLKVPKNVLNRVR